MAVSKRTLNANVEMFFLQVVCCLDEGDCDENAECVIENGDSVCRCKEGFFETANGECKDIDECRDKRICPNVN